MNKCYYGGIYRAIQGLSFVVYCAVEIMSANTCTFAFCKIHVFCIGKGKMAVDEVFQLTSSAKSYQYYAPPPPSRTRVGERWGFGCFKNQIPHPWGMMSSQIPM